MHANDELIPLTQAAKLSPGRPSTNCVWRWCRKGVRARSGQRVRLQHVRVGSTIFTSRQWLEEFGQHVAAADTTYFDNQVPTMPPVKVQSRSAKQRQAAVANARTFLQETGL